MGEDTAQIKAFTDIWFWHSTEHEPVYDRLLHRGGAIGNFAEAMHILLGRCGMLAYILFMTERVIQMHRVLKKTGSLYLHCDPTASHFLKLMLDAVFGIAMFRNESVWKRNASHNDAKRMGKSHDVIFYYSRTNKPIWNKTFQSYSENYLRTHYQKIDNNGRRFEDRNLTAFGLSGGGYEYSWKGVTKLWRCPKETMEAYDNEGKLYYTRNHVPRYKQYLDEMSGVPLQDIWNDIPPINSQSAERLGYPTQKPLALLKRIIEASSRPGDVVLDPFCGCGTAVDAAQALERRWIGMDVSVLAINVITARMQDTHGEVVMADVNITGIPTSIEAARMLHNQNKLEFERWAVGIIGGKPNDKQVGDGGSDGELLFPSAEKGRVQRGILSVKGGAQLNPGMVRDLDGTVNSTKAVMGVFICLRQPTRGMIEAAQRAGIWQDSLTGKTYPRIQIVTIAQLLDGHCGQMPTPLNPYRKAGFTHDTQQVLL